MNILVIMTGGTISCVKDGDWITPDETRTYVLLDHYRQTHKDTDAEFETVVPYTTLSEQLSSEHLNKLIACVREHKDNGYDGIIITHGTDTLQYTAAALQFVFGAHSLPIVLVSSNYPLGDRRANGHRNFAAAVAFIRSKTGKGTFVSYKNADLVTRIHRATRLLTHPETGDDVYSLGRAPYAVCEDDVIIKNTAYRRGGIGKAYENTVFSENAGVLAVSMCPGDTYAYDLAAVKAVLIRPYHSGTLNTAGEAFRAFCKRAVEKHIPLFVVDVPKGDGSYASSKAFDGLGLTVLPFSAFVPMYMKLWLAVSLGEDIRGFALTPLAEEFLTDEL
ncbi:MAG: asparaginase [Ruminococcaceae bacterium]|nr:asparaginase [Oscillospiraceae bacterium]